jgi:hypothetical protein
MEGKVHSKVRPEFLLALMLIFFSSLVPDFSRFFLPLFALPNYIINYGTHSSLSGPGLCSYV